MRPYSIMAWCICSDCTFVSKMLSGNASLQTATQLNLHTVESLGPIIHEQKVSVVAIK